MNKLKLQKIVVEEVDFAEIKICRDETEANKLLTDGWLLLNAGVSHTDSAGYQAKIHFIVGKKRQGA